MESPLFLLAILWILPASANAQEAASVPTASAPTPATSTAPAPRARILRLPRGTQIPDPLDKPVEAAARFLLSRITPAGPVADEFPAGNPRFGGKTALCVYALLSAEADDRDEALRRAVDWLKKQRLAGTYAVAMRACAYAALYRITEDRALVKPLEDDVQWLIDAADKDGGYTYTSRGGKPRQAYDNSNSQLAVLGVYAGAAALDLDVPAAYWRRVERHWVTQQQADGGWGYLVPGGSLRTKSYGSMTAAGLATLYLCFDHLHREEFLRATMGSEYKPIASAHEWLAGHFSPADNPGKGVEWYFYWLYSLERVGMASGEKYLGGHDWFGKVLGELLSQQGGDGAFGGADPVSDTAFAMMFLARGRHPMLLHKLNYPGKWNSRPRDAANLVDWWSSAYERPVRWQAIRLDATSADLHEAPILYISGAGPIELNDSQVDTLRRFVNEGGTIVSEAAGNNADFTLDVKKLYQRLFPSYEPARLPDSHPIYAMNVQKASDAGLTAVSNGVRLLAVHATELSLGLQMGPGPAWRQSFDQLAGICLYVTDNGTLRARTAEHWPKAQEFTPRATIRVARLRHEGNCDPEPLAWQRLTILMGNKHKVRLEAAGPIDIAGLDFAKHPIAGMTGTGDFKLKASEREALKKFLAAGGTLVVDAAGGAKPFADAVERELFGLIPGGIVGDVASNSPVYAGVRISYRREFATALGETARTQGRLRGVQDDQRLAIIFSPDDLTAGLVGYPVYGLRGYSPDTAANLMMNILLNAAGVKPR